MPDMVRTLLQAAKLRKARLDHPALDALGIAVVFRARRIRYPPTGFGFKINVSPARALHDGSQHATVNPRLGER